MSGGLFSRGMAASYRAGNAHIRKINAANRAARSARGGSPLSAVGLTDKSGAIAASDTGTVPAPAQKIFKP
jgi:hypothetical protein